MKFINDYYNNRKIKYGISGDRKGKILPLLAKFKGCRVLDAGCASGYTGEILRKQGNYVVGWDMITRDVETARKVLDEAHLVDLESSNWPRVNKKFDLIVFSEVVEHLFSPETVLRRLLTYLKPGGSILISTPNILHLYMRTKFIRGEYEYKDESVSVINPAHFHLFTYSSLKRLARRVGLSVEDENHVIFPRTLAILWKHWPGVFAYQLVFLFKKPSSK